ncbi:hypothetical protein AM1_1818 [Acaryochloris marina MBIC11017]|uniref:Uncharacterized protein n=2 Tax=Acaryochloris marina TaxID=155978 RepID=B0CDB4_ACAM1|nr:hypothetical protein AM1_1818 [Acaryochloris marina MBIC11017]
MIAPPEQRFSMSVLPIVSRQSEREGSSLTHLQDAKLVVVVTGEEGALLISSERCMTCPVGTDADLKQQKLALEGILPSVRDCLPAFTVIVLAHLRRLTQLSIGDRFTERLMQRGLRLRSQAVLAADFDLSAARNLSESVALTTHKSFLSDRSIRWMAVVRSCHLDVTVLLRGDRLFQVRYSAIRPFGGYGCAHLDISPRLNHSL